MSWDLGTSVFKISGSFPNLIATPATSRRDPDPLSAADSTMSQARDPRVRKMTPAGADLEFQCLQASEKKNRKELKAILEWVQDQKSRNVASMTEDEFKKIRDRVDKAAQLYSGVVMIREQINVLQIPEQDRTAIVEYMKEQHEVLVGPLEDVRNWIDDIQWSPTRIDPQPGASAAGPPLVDLSSAPGGEGH